MYNLTQNNNKLVWSQGKQGGRKIIVEFFGDCYNITDDSGIPTYVNVTTVSPIVGSYFILCMIAKDYDVIHRLWNSGGWEYREYEAKQYFAKLEQMSH